MNKNNPVKTLRCLIMAVCTAVCITALVQCILGGLVLTTATVMEWHKSLSSSSSVYNCHGAPFGTTWNTTALCTAGIM